MSNSLIRNISDTARWAAFYRASESERPDAVFKDPFARKLAGSLGEEIAQTVTFSTENSWSWIARTYLFDQFLAKSLAQGTDMVVNLAAGLDARPYRMNLPASLKWIEVDLPEILDYKTELLASDTPSCKLERVKIDLANVSARRELFDRLGRQGQRALILTEGLIVYFTGEEVAGFAQDLAAIPTFTNWITDLSSPGLLKLLKEKMGAQMGSGAVLKFGPAEGPNFFEKYGWTPVETRSLLKAARKIKRLSFFMHLMAPLTPEVPTPRQASRPWGGVTLLQKKST